MLPFYPPLTAYGGAYSRIIAQSRRQALRLAFLRPTVAGTITPLYTLVRHGGGKTADTKKTKRKFAYIKKPLPIAML